MRNKNRQREVRSVLAPLERLFVLPDNCDSYMGAFGSAHNMGYHGYSAQSSKHKKYNIMMDIILLSPKQFQWRIQYYGGCVLVGIREG